MKDPELPPTESLTWEAFEDLTERLLSAHRFCGDAILHVTRVERWGRRGDKQDGIDFEGSWSDDATASWQCKRQVKLTASDVKEAVEACTFRADRHYLVFSGEASRDARIEMRKHPGWQLIDRRGLKRLIDDLPLQHRRQVLDATWGVSTRKRILATPGEDAFLLPADAAAPRLNSNALLNDCGPTVGRDEEARQLDEALKPGFQRQTVVIVSGSAGRGKTRLLLEALARAQEEFLGMPVLYGAPGRTIDENAIRELPHAPALIAVDDPDGPSTTALANYALRTPGTQLLIGTRTDRVAVLLSALARSGVDNIKEIPIGPLSRRPARALVESLSSDLEMNESFTRHLADEAVSAPHVAVIALNLARRGKFSGLLRLSSDLSNVVMRRYQEVQTEAIGSSPSAVVQRTLATYAAIGPVSRDEHTVLLEQIGNFCGSSRIEHLKLLGNLADRGVITNGDVTLRVVPNVLADRILQSESAAAGHDTGFVSEVWNEFAELRGRRLLVNLAELDWRLDAEGAPTVLTEVWRSVRGDMLAGNLAETSAGLQRLEALSHTQPRRLTALLEDIRARDFSVPISSDRRTPATNLTKTVIDPASARLFGVSPPSIFRLHSQMSKLYGQCAIAEPELLEVALDSLWFIHRTAGANASVGTVVGRLADLGAITDATVAARIVARVRHWALDSADDPSADPSFVLKALLAKQGMRTVQTAPLEMAFHPYLISAEAIRPVRDAVRQVLCEFACSGVNVRAGSAIELLDSALGPPHGAFGKEIDREDILKWEDDDLASIGVLGEIAHTAPSAVVRRRVRRAVGWSAEHATSDRVRYAALRIITELDQLHDDDVAEMLLNEFRFVLPSRRGIAMPVFDAKEAQDSDSGDGDRAVDTDDGALQTPFDERERANAAVVARAVEALWSDRDTVGAIDEIERTASEIVSLWPAKNIGLWSIYRHTVEARPALVPEIAQMLVSRRPSLLDNDLPFLLDAWSRLAESDFVRWLQGAGAARPEVEDAIARAYDIYGWAGRGGEFSNTLWTGLRNANPAIRQKFLRAIHPLLRATPSKTLDLLPKQEFTPDIAAHLIQYICGANGSEWASQLIPTDAKAILWLLGETACTAWCEHELIAGIASAQPVMVLEHLNNQQLRRQSLPVEIPPLPEALQRHPRSVAAWVLSRALQRDAPLGALVVGLALAGGVSDAQSEALSAVVEEASPAALPGILELLQLVDAWALQQPTLAHNVVKAADRIGPEMVTVVLAKLKAAASLSHWSMENGVSSEVEWALDRLSKCLSLENDSRIRAIYESTKLHMEQESQSIATRYADLVDGVADER